MLKPGDVVRVREGAVIGPNCLHVNKLWTDEHGWLWVIVRRRFPDGSDKTSWVCRSVATGKGDHFPDKEPIWFAERELEAVYGVV